MGKASKWFRGLLGLKKPDRNPIPSEKPASPKKKWSFSMSHKEKDLHKPQHGRVLAVAVKQTSRGGNSSATAYVSRSCAGYWTREEWAAVMIQSRFRAYLSRRALRALKALVKLQALVRGHLLRKRTADTLRQLQALVRAQTRARVTRLLLSDQSPHPHGPATPQKIEQHVIRMNHQHSIMLKRNGSKSNSLINYDREKSHLGRVWIDSKTSERLSEQGSFTRSTTTPTDDERSDKILHVDTQKPRFTPKRRNLFHSSFDQNCPSFSTSKDSGEIQSFSPLKYAQTSSLSSPRYYSAISSKREETFTPTKSDGSRSYLSGCSDNPNYMAYTESSKAKARSLSVPKQRQQQYEKSSSMKRYSVHHVYGGHESNFTSKAYPGSGRLDRLGMPISRGDVSRFSGGHWHRYY